MVCNLLVQYSYKYIPHITFPKGIQQLNVCTTGTLHLATTQVGALTNIFKMSKTFLRKETKGLYFYTYIFTHVGIGNKAKWNVLKQRQVYSTTTCWSNPKGLYIIITSTKGIPLVNTRSQSSLQLSFTARSFISELIHSLLKYSKSSSDHTQGTIPKVQFTQRYWVSIIITPTCERYTNTACCS